jgi:hypothetical protein
MTEQLRDVLTRVADRSGPVSVDPSLWSRAVRTRRRRQGFTAAAAVLLVITLVGGIVLATGVHRTASPPVDRPDRHDPIEIVGIAGDGGLRLEKDLAIGRGSVAIVNDTAAFVVTADDGVAHRLALPGFDAPLYARAAAESGADLSEMLSLSPDGTKLIYAWHEPFVPQPTRCSRSVCGEPGEGWVQSGARLLDLTTGVLDTYPSRPDELSWTSQLSRTNSGFRWSADSRLVAFYEGAGGPAAPTESWGGRILDTTQKVRWSEGGLQLNPRSVDEMSGLPDSAAPALDNAGQAAWVNTPVLRGEPQLEKQSLMTSTDGARPQPLPVGTAGWGSGRFSPDGQTLLLEPAGLDDRILAIDPGRPDSARQLLLKGELPSDSVRTELVGWVGTDQALATVHQASGTGSWEGDADLALLNLDLDARTADVTVVGRVDTGDTGSAFSLAGDLLAVDLSANDSESPMAEAPGPAKDSAGSSALDRTGLSDHPWPALAALGLLSVPHWSG